jgi:hypothetical protein
MKHMGIARHGHSNASLRTSWIVRAAGSCLLFAAASAIPSASSAAELAYQGTFAWLAVGSTYTIEDNHSYFVGEFGGSFIATNEGGPFNGIGIICPGFNDIGVASAGYCILTDAAGDKAFMNWNCKAAAPTPAALVSNDCTLNFEGGTGKFTGAKGSGPFRAYITAINPNGKASGYSLVGRAISVTVGD